MRGFSKDTRISAGSEHRTAERTGRAEPRWRWPGSRRPSVLIVNTDAEKATMLREALESAGFRAVAKTHGREAVGAAAREPFDVAIVDRELADASGPDVLLDLRARFPELRTIFLRALDGRGRARTSDSRGTGSPMKRSPHLDVLVDTVHAALVTPGGTPWTFAS